MATDLYGRGLFDAILSIGGVQNTTIAAAAMKACPSAFPKLSFQLWLAGREHSNLSSAARISCDSLGG